VIDWVLYVLHQWGAIVLLPVFFAASVLFALLFRLGLGRATSVRPIGKIGVAGISFLILFAILPAWAAYAPALPSREFDSQTWRAKPWRRSSMVHDVVRTQLRAGMPRQEVHALLGDGDGSYDAGDAWEVWRPRDALDLFSSELVVQYDRGGRVERYFIEPSLIETVFSAV